MWLRLPLSAKLILSLFILQSAILLVGAVWLTHWSTASKTGELNARLDAMSDVIEDMVTPDHERLTLARRGETDRELNADPNTYFSLVAADGVVASTSSGPPAEVRAALQATLEAWVPTTQGTRMLAIGHGHWLAQSEVVKKKVGGAIYEGTLHIASNAQPMLDELKSFDRYVFAAALGILIVTSLGTGVVVSYSTANLRKFARELGEVRPPRFETKMVLAPRSMEENLLFSGYGNLATTVRDALEAQRLFIAHASHELKTPIAAAIAATEVILSRPRAPKEYEETHREVLAELQVLKRLSLTLLDLAQLDDPMAREVEAATCQLLTVVELVLDRWRKSAGERGISLIFDRPAAVLPEVRGAGDQWEVVVGNLVDNAVKYGKRGGRVALTLATRAEGGVELQVKDDGRGMTADELARLGEVFFRADKARSHDGSFGLGFAHAKRLVEHLAGRIEVASQPTSGTLVTVIAKS